MPSRTSHKTPGASGPKQSTKPPTKAARYGKHKEALVDRTRRDHEASDDQTIHHGEKRFSVAVSRWLDEPIAEGPYNGIAGVAGWQGQEADGSIEMSERKRKSGKNKKK